MIKSFFKNNSIHKKIVPVFDILFLFRPTLFFVVWLMISIGLYLGYLLDPETNSYQWIFNFDFKSFSFYISMTFLTGSSFITNQISDVKSDEINNKLFIVDKVIDKNKVIFIYKIGLYTGLFFLFCTINFLSIVIGAIIFLLWDKIYNNKPFEWKKHPFLGPLCNILVGLLLILGGFLSFENNQFFNILIILQNIDWFVIYVLPYLLCYMAVTLITDIPDIKGDKANNKKTFTILLGERKTILFSTILVLISSLLAHYLEDPLSSHASIVSLPFFFFALIRGHEKDILRSIRYPIFILNFFTMIIFPYLFITSLVIFYLSKYYYWHRFDLHYPTFLVDND